MGQTYRRIDLLDADRFASRSCFFPRASDALDVSARRGVALPLRLRTHCLSTRTIRRPGGRVEDAIVAGRAHLEQRDLRSAHCYGLLSTLGPWRGRDEQQP